MKKVITGILTLAILLMLTGFVPASASNHRNLEACFDWRINKQGVLVLDASCSSGYIEEYYWEIKEDCDYDYIVDQGSGCIYQTYLGPGRYNVTLTVFDVDGCQEDSITWWRVVIPERVYRRRPKPRGKITLEISLSLTKEEKRLLGGLILIIIGGLIVLGD